MYNFDKVDVKIVNILLEDGRMPASEIARRIGEISERAVRYRIERMVEAGIIQVSAVAKPQAFGLTTIADVWMEVEAEIGGGLAGKGRAEDAHARLLDDQTT